jgi:hypothetical protein
MNLGKSACPSHILVCCFNGGNLDNLTLVIIPSLMWQRGLIKEELSESWFICFSVDGAFLFIGYHIEVTS